MAKTNYFHYVNYNKGWTISVKIKSNNGEAMKKVQIYMGNEVDDDSLDKTIMTEQVFYNKECCLIKTDPLKYICVTDGLMYTFTALAEIVNVFRSDENDYDSDKTYAYDKQGNKYLICEYHNDLIIIKKGFDIKTSYKIATNSYVSPSDEEKYEEFYKNMIFYKSNYPGYRLCPIKNYEIDYLIEKLISYDNDNDNVTKEKIIDSIAHNREIIGVQQIIDLNDNDLVYGPQC